MHRHLRFFRALLGTTLVAFLAFTLAFEFTVVQPALSKAASLLAAAAPSERSPPATLMEALDRSQPELRKYQVARDLLAQPPSQIEGLRTLSRQSLEHGLGISLKLHLSEQDLSALHLSQAYMGPGVRGYAQASAIHLGVPLESVTREQAAKLVAISLAPAANLASPERLARRVELLLSARRQ
ncbi:transglycosylase domain-containing protein [Aquincola sp. S2]|uniref:Transglycosylase domain-containing protein n=1 Tax=Pseudaquabacterium terrae TaxID=2732868 RepID=A0ABX2EUM8_9BURK|nr:transglycosylase domain-containing protein [Aquabacterium terrae]NRF72450.1 transglycosylase domain-containing protein [Aquabacterium terrae]